MKNVYLDTAEGQKLFRKSQINFELLRWFTTQINSTYCGVASSVIALNALGIKGPSDSSYNGECVFTQENLFSSAFGTLLKKEKVLKEGMGLEELGAALGALAKVSVQFALKEEKNDFDALLREALLNLSLIHI